MFAVKSYKHQTLPFSFLVVFADGGAYYRATDLQRAFQVTNISRPLASCRGETVRFRMLRDRYAIPAAAYSGVIGAEASLLTLAGLKTFANYGTLSLSPVYKWVTEELPRLVEADMASILMCLTVYRRTHPAARHECSCLRRSWRIRRMCSVRFC